MRALIALLLSLWLAPAWAQVPMTGAGRGAPSSGSTYQGPGDVYASNPYAWYSCARAFTASYASGGSLCEIQRTSDNTKCTLVASSSGFADLVTANCSGNTQTIVQFCNATTCGISQAFDQTGNSRHVVQATIASQPTLTFNSTPTGTLPSITCSGTLVLASSATYTQSSPISSAGVFIRTSGTGLGGTLGANATVILLGSNSTANSWLVVGASGNIGRAATDSTWHASVSVIDGASSVLAVDGSETTGSVTGSFSSNNIRLCRAAASELIGDIAEAGFWSSAMGGTDRTNLNTNMHGINGYNF